MPAVAHSVEPLYVPDYTAVSTTEAAAARTLQPGLIARLAQSGFLVIDGARAANVVGGNIANCSLQYTCPGEPLGLLPAQLALVISIAARGGNLSANIQVYDRADPIPLDDYSMTVESGFEDAFYDQVVRGLRDVIRLVKSATPEMVAQAQSLVGVTSTSTPVVVFLDDNPRLAEQDELTRIVPAAPLDLDFVDEPDVQEITPSAPMTIDLGEVNPTPLKRFELDQDALEVGPQNSAAPAPVAPAPLPIEPVAASAPSAPVPLRTIDRSEMTIEEILQDTGIELKHVDGAEAHLKKSGMDPRDWVFKFSPHAGRVIVELRGGVANGDVDRAADLRIALDGGEQVSSWFQESPVAASRLRGALYFGYAPFTAIDLGVAVGIQYGFRALTTGWSTEADAGLEETVSGVSIVQAAQGYIQPRARAYLVHLGPLKPFVVVGADFRVLDKYDLDQPDGLQYPSPPAATYPGILGGGGVLLDPSPIVGVFLESTYSQHFGVRAQTIQTGEWSGSVPAIRGYGQSTVSVVAGLQFRL